MGLSRCWPFNFKPETLALYRQETITNLEHEQFCHFLVAWMMLSVEACLVRTGIWGEGS